jgi:hypothetical protein
MEFVNPSCTDFGLDAADGVKMGKKKKKILKPVDT